MSDATTPTTPVVEPKAPVVSPTDEKISDTEKTPESGLIARLNSEKEKRQAADARIAEFEAEKAKEAEEKAKKNGEFEKLLNERDQKLKDLSPKAEAYEKMMKAATERVDTLIEKLPKEDRSLVESMKATDPLGAETLANRLLDIRPKNVGTPSNPSDASPSGQPDITLALIKQKTAEQDYAWLRANQKTINALQKAGHLK